MAQRYTLGPLDGPDLVLTDTAQHSQYGRGAFDEYGVTWLCGYPTGWDDDDFQTPVDTPDGVDGALFGPQRRGHKQIGISGTLIADDRAGAKAAVQRLRAALPSRGSTVFAVTDEDDQRLWVPARPSGTVRAVPKGGRAAVFTFGLVSPDPWRYGDQVDQRAVGLPDPTQQSGLTLPVTLGTITFATTTPVGGQVVVQQWGDLDAWPISTIDGPALWPMARNETSGLYAQFGIRLAAGSRMVVDHRTGLITVNGIQTEVPLVGYGSVLWPLVPGRNDISWSSRDDYDARALLGLAWYPTYR